jgi:ATP-binding cassette subfamily B protein
MRPPTEERKLSDLQIYRRVLRWARPFTHHLVILFLLQLVATPLALLNPVPLKIVVDSVLGDLPLPGWLGPIAPAAPPGSRSILAFAVLLLVAITVLSRMRGVVAEALEQYTGEKLILRFRSALFRHLQRLSFAIHDTRGVSDSVYRIQYDAQSIQSIVVYRLTAFVGAIVTVVSMLYVILRLDWELGLVALVVAPALFLLTRLYRKRLRRQWHEVKEHETAALSVVQEVMGALRVVKAFGQEEREHERFVSRSSEGLSARLRVTVMNGLIWVLVSVVTATGTAIVLYLGVIKITTGALSLGNLLIMMGYLAQLYEPLKTIATEGMRLQSSLAGAERVFAVLDHTPDVPQAEHPQPLPRANGRIAFEDVGFAYGGDAPTLTGISFTAEPGMRIGVAGPTGAGKTTLVSLLPRFYDPTEGRILLDGVDLRDYRIEDLRNQFAIVLQDTVLFSTTIGENIAYARPGASMEEIVAAAEAARAHDFIQALPDGYETRVGERGMRLSGGERQRISLARAFLKDAPILILDEPTSAIDPRTEAEILDATERLMRDRTTFFISHRPAGLERCDLRLVLDGGRLVASAPSLGGEYLETGAVLPDLLRRLE